MYNGKSCWREEDDGSPPNPRFNVEINSVPSSIVYQNQLENLSINETTPSCKSFLKRFWFIFTDGWRISFLFIIIFPIIYLFISLESFKVLYACMPRSRCSITIVYDTFIFCVQWEIDTRTLLHFYKLVLAVNLCFVKWNFFISTSFLDTKFSIFISEKK